MKIHLYAIIAIILTVILLGNNALAQNTLEKAREQGFITVGFANEVPYAYAQPDGTLTGEAVEVARAVFQRLGIDEMVGVLTEFGSLIPGLQAGRFDAITAGMYITPVRCEQVAFADPEYSIGEGLLVRAGNPNNLQSYEDIAANPEVRVGTGAGWLEYDYLLDVGVNENQIVTFPDGPAGVSGLLAGRIDAFTGTGPTMQALMENNTSDQIERVESFQDPVIDGEPLRSYGGAAFRLEDTELRDAFNRELQALKESGELLEIVSEFGFTEQELPGDMTAEQLCNP
jgi:polar amino acid transport system substrate-binding protein